jgi:tetratricopeptide (TPR) repeat protein
LAPFLKKTTSAELEPDPEPELIAVESSSAPVQSEADSAAEGAIRFEPPVVGRSAQLRKLWTLHRQAIDHGRGALVLVTGETGVGKTRLLEAFRDGILEGAEMEWCAGETGQKGGHGLGALRGALAELFGVRGQDRELTRKHIVDVMSCWGTPDAEDVERLTALFLPGSGGGASPGRFADDDNDERAHAEREQLFGVIERVLRRAAADRPLLVCLEDLHWAGSPTWEFLEFLSPRLKNAPEPLLFVGTMRSDAPEAKVWAEAVGRLQRYEGEAFHRIELAALDEDQSKTLIRTMLKGTERLTQSVLGMTSGNPLHLIQILRFLHDSDLIVQKDGIWDLPEGQKAKEIVPPALADLMSARLEQVLSRHKQREELTRIIHRCALVGRKVPYRLLHRLLELESEMTPGLRPLMGLLEEALDLFVQEGVLVEDLENTEDVLTFAHGMLRESLNQALKGRRTTRATHLAAAMAKEQYWSRTPDAYSAEIAQHYEEAKRWPEALEWHVKAASAARRTWDLRACEDHYQQAQNLLAQAPEAKPLVRRQILQALGELRMTTGQNEQAEQLFRQAFEVAEDSGESEAMAHLLFLQGNVARERGKARDAERCYRECLAVSRALGVREGIGNALLGLSKLARESGATAEAHRFLTAAEEQFEGSQDTRALADTSRQRAFIYMKEGNWSEAKQQFKNALQFNLQREDKWGLAHVHRDLAELAVLRGRNDEGQINARKALDLFENIGARFGFAKSVFTLAEVHKAQGHFQAAGEQFQRALSIYEALGAQPEISETMFQIGVVALRLGRPREAKTWFDQARVQAAQVDDAFLEGMALAGLAWAGASGDDPQSTRAYLQHAHRRLPRDTNFVPDLADIYLACARCFENHNEKALAEACRRKGQLIQQSLGRA